MKLKDYYDKLLQNEISFGKSPIRSISYIKREFDAVLGLAGIKKSDILLAYVLGSYARDKKTQYSDIDIEVITGEQQDDLTILHKNNIYTVYVHSLMSFKQLMNSTENVIWYADTMDVAKILYDRNNTYSSLRQYVLKKYETKPISEFLLTELKQAVRRVIEDRRKIYALIILKRKNYSPEIFNITYIDFAKKFVDNYAKILTTISKKKQKSEENYFDDLLREEGYASEISMLLDLGTPDNKRLSILDDLLAHLQRKIKHIT